MSPVYLKSWFLFLSAICFKCLDIDRLQTTGAAQIVGSSKSVVLKTQSLNQQHQNHLGTCQKSIFSYLIRDLLNQKGLAQGLLISGLTRPLNDSDASSRTVYCTDQVISKQELENVGDLKPSLFIPVILNLFGPSECFIILREYSYFNKLISLEFIE